MQVVSQVLQLKKNEDVELVICRQPCDLPSPSLSYRSFSYGPIEKRAAFEGLTNRENASLNSDTCSSVSESA